MYYLNHLHFEHQIENIVSILHGLTEKIYLLQKSQFINILYSSI